MVGSSILPGRALKINNLQGELRPASNIVLPIFYTFFYFDRVKAKATTVNTNPKNKKGAGGSKSGRMERVLDSRRHPIRGLWRCGSRYYAQMRFPGETSARKIPLMVDDRPVRTTAEAIEARDRLRLHRKDGRPIAARGTKPMFPEAVATYCAHHKALAAAEDARRIKLLAQGAVGYEWPGSVRKPSTVDSEAKLLNHWVTAIGNIRVDKITRAHVVTHLKKLESQGRAGSTRNSYAVALRNFFKDLADRGTLTPDLLPTRNLDRASVKRPPTEFLHHRHVARLLAVARRLGDRANNITAKQDDDDLLRNGHELADLIALLAYSGARLGETLRLTWNDVDLDGGTLHLGTDGRTKNGRPRKLPLNPDLAAHLKAMTARRLPDCPWLFPSPRRQKDADDSAARPWLNVHKSFEKLRDIAATADPGMTEAEARDIARLRTTRLHDLRHHFASVALMAGVPVATVAGFLGHLDGGALCMKTYGHLCADHAREQAQRLVFNGPRLVEAEPPVAKSA